jgi:hypothetical protein
MMASQSLCGLDTLFSAIDEGSRQQITPANIIKYDETAEILLGLSSKSNPRVDNLDATDAREASTNDQRQSESTDEETESDEESETVAPTPVKEEVLALMAVDTKINPHEIVKKIERREVASLLVGCAFEFNGVKIPLFTAKVDGRIQTMLIPCVMVHELCKHWDSQLAQKEARRFYVNKLIGAGREGGAVFTDTYYIDLENRRNARFHACSLDVLNTMMLDRDSEPAKKWVKLTNQLIDTPPNKKPPRKRKRLELIS